MSDIFRQKYTELTEDQKNLIASIKTKAGELYDLYPHTEDDHGVNREISLAMTALEESVMWAIKGCTK